MTVYALPPEPEGPLYEPDGHKWVRGGGGYWEDSYGHNLSWYGLMSSRVQLTDVPPEPPLGEVRWHNTNPEMFVVRARSHCWRSYIGMKVPAGIVERDYTRPEPAPAEEGDR